MVNTEFTWATLNQVLGILGFSSLGILGIATAESDGSLGRSPGNSILPFHQLPSLPLTWHLREGAWRISFLLEGRSKLEKPGLRRFWSLVPFTFWCHFITCLCAAAKVFQDPPERQVPWYLVGGPVVRSPGPGVRFSDRLLKQRLMGRCD